MGFKVGRGTKDYLYKINNSSSENQLGILSVEHKLRMFQNVAFRKVYVLKTGELATQWRRLHNGELDRLYDPADIIRITRVKRFNILNKY